MKINITEEDIKLGKPGMHWDCPIALALKRQGIDAYVCYLGILERVRENAVINHPPSLEAQRFMESFDDNEPVQPGELEVWNDE